MNITTRIYNDFFRPPQYEGYERILKAAKVAGYEFHSVLSFENTQPKRAKYLIIRRDVDTKDIKCMRALLDLEKKYGARSTSYFRWNTYDVQLMSEITDAGSEASYHYEEAATFCYKHRIKTKEEMIKHIEDIKDLFIKRYEEFKALTGQPCLTIAAHGDYVNSKFHFQNYEFIDNRIRDKCSFIREAYDKEHLKHITCRIADQREGDLFVHKAIAAIERGEPVIELLTHPRQWNSPILINLKEEINRFCKQIYMRL